jgi:hypothetical protein
MAAAMSHWARFDVRPQSSLHLISSPHLHPSLRTQAHSEAREVPQFSNSMALSHASRASANYKYCPPSCRHPRRHNPLPSTLHHRDRPPSTSTFHLNTTLPTSSPRTFTRCGLPIPHQLPRPQTRPDDTSNPPQNGHGRGQVLHGTLRCQTQ